MRERSAICVGYRPAERVHEPLLIAPALSVLRCPLTIPRRLPARFAGKSNEEEPRDMRNYPIIIVTIISVAAILGVIAEFVAQF